jgi:DNA polymerase-4
MILVELEQIARTLCERIERHQASGRTLTLKVKFSDYRQITRSRTFEKCIDSLDAIITEAVELLKIVELENKSIRLLGISLSNLDNQKKLQIVQLSLFE